MDWNTPVIISSDGDGSIILIFQAATRSIDWSATIVAANAELEVLVSRKIVLWIEFHKKADADVDDENLIADKARWQVAATNERLNLSRLVMLWEVKEMASWI